MIGGAAKKPTGERSPGFERGTPLDQLMVRGRKLPHAVDAVTCRRRRKRHLLQVLCGSLVVVHRGYGDEMLERKRGDITRTNVRCTAGDREKNLARVQRKT